MDLAKPHQATDEEKQDRLSGPQCITHNQQMVSSFIGAVVTSLFVTPFDVVKIRLQTQQKEFLNKKCFIYSNGVMDHLCYCVNGNGTAHIHSPHGSTISIKWYKRPIPSPFTGTLDALMKIRKAEGIGSLWSGLPPTLLMAIPATMIYFVLYDSLRINLWSWLGSEEQPMWIPVVCGAFARLVSATAISPLEMVRTKVQSGQLNNSTIRRALTQHVKIHGVLGLWRGIGPTLLRDIPFSSIYWTSYETLKQKFGSKEPSLVFCLVAGSISGSIASVTTLPFDVVKTHRQIEFGESEISPDSKGKRDRQTRTSQILRNIYQRNGIAGLFSGIVPRVAKVAPSCAIMITCYELGKQYFIRKNEALQTS